MSPPRQDKRQHHGESSSAYESKKPKWWGNVGGSRKPTKNQRRAMEQIMPRCQLNKPANYFDKIQWNQVFPGEKHEIWVELGFGRGENLLALHHTKPDRQFVGAEVHKPGVAILCQRIQESIQKNSHWTDYVRYDDSSCRQETDEQEYCPLPAHDKDSLSLAAAADDDKNLFSNLKIFMGNGMNLLHYVPSGSVHAILLTFPDPFPRPGHEKWRIVQVDTLQEIHRTLVPHVGRFFLATDDTSFVQWTHEKIMTTSPLLQGQFEAVDPCPPRSEWLPAVSAYEQKGWKEGRSTHVFCWRAL